MSGKCYRVLIDTNIAYTYLTGRDDPYAASIERLMADCAYGRVNGFLAFHSLSTIWYLSRKAPDEIRRAWLMRLCRILDVAGAGRHEVMDAINRTQFKDFEDCLQDKCAKESSCDFIITANIKDYQCSEVPAVTPDRIVELIGG